MDQAQVLPQSSPLFRNIHHSQIQHFQQAIIGRKDGLGLGHLAQLAVEALNGVGGADQPAHLLGILETGTQVCPVCPPRLRDFRVFLVPALPKGVQTIQGCLFTHSGIDSLQTYIVNQATAMDSLLFLWIFCSKFIFKVELTLSIICISHHSSIATHLFFRTALAPPYHKLRPVHGIGDCFPQALLDGNHLCHGEGLVLGAVVVHPLEALKQYPVESVHRLVCFRQGI